MARRRFWRVAVSRQCAARSAIAATILPIQNFYCQDVVKGAGRTLALQPSQNVKDDQDIFHHMCMMT
jgi:hypothetical protein